MQQNFLKKEVNINVQHIDKDLNLLSYTQIRNLINKYS